MALKLKLESIRDEIGEFIFLSMNLRRISLNSIGLYNGQPIILKLIEENPGLSQKEFAKLAQISKPTLNVMLSRLQKKGFVEVKYDEKNSKTSHVYITESGKIKNKDAQKVLDEFQEFHYLNFTEEEKETFKKLLSKMSKNLENRLKEAEYENN